MKTGSYPRVSEVEEAIGNSKKFGFGEKHMDKKTPNRLLASCSDNRKPVLSEVEGSKTCTAFDKLRPRACRGELSRRSKI